MKKRILIVVPFLMMMSSAHGSCTLTSTIYTSCKTGYYLSNNDCIRCPQVGTHTSGEVIYGMTVDYNTGGITSCYAPTGPYVNDTGMFSYDAVCYYQ